MSTDNITIVEYERVYWAMLSDTLRTLLSEAPGTFKPISYAEMYSAVYKCVCRQYSERLFDDLTGLVKGTLCEWCDRLAPLEGLELVNEFHRSLAQYFFALANVVPIFSYLNKFYVESKLQSNLNRELLRLFSEMVADKFIHKLMGK